MRRLLHCLGFYKFELTTKVYCLNHAGISDVSGRVIKRLSENVSIIRQTSEEDCDVIVASCPIVSRAGTDIEAALSRCRDDKPVLVLVFHHTFSSEYTAPNSNRYANNKRMLVDILFHEDRGLLTCVKNTEAISKAENYLKKCGKRQHKVNIKRVLAVCLTGLGIYVLYNTWLSRLASTDQIS